MLVNSVASSVFPVDNDSFDRVYSLLLPSLCCYDYIPAVLRNIRNCLRLGGIFDCVLIDPLPNALTLGHNMRAWLEKHLIPNLEKEKLCTAPCRLFPRWLGEASLRGRGSSRVVTKFFAIPGSVPDTLGDPDPVINANLQNKKARAELMSLIGRILWIEVWGRYVTASRWWWEEELCVQECVEMGTFWEYHKIEGVKGEKPPGL